MQRLVPALTLSISLIALCAALTSLMRPPSTSNTFETAGVGDEDIERRLAELDERLAVLEPEFVKPGFRAAEKLATSPLRAPSVSTENEEPRDHVAALAARLAALEDEEDHRPPGTCWT